MCPVKPVLVALSWKQLRVGSTDCSSYFYYQTVNRTAIAMTIETYCDHRSRTRRIGPTYHLNEKDGGALLSQAAATAVQFNLAIIAILYRAQCSLHTISPTSSHGVHKTASTILRTSSTSGVNLCYCTLYTNRLAKSQQEMCAVTFPQVQQRRRILSFPLPQRETRRR